jgi:chitodextrinase
VDLFTTPGTAPELPATVTTVLRDGRGELPVTWDVPGDDAWAEPGTVEVRGTVTTPAGTTVDATATVVVDVLTDTRRASATTYVGGLPALPDTVTAVAAGGTDVERPVTWEAVADAAVAQVGVVEVTGTADAGSGRTLPATVRVLVTAPGEANAALADGTTAAATFTEPGYPAQRVVNGDLTDKGWSNWRSGTKNPTDTLTVSLPAERDLTRVVTRFWRDGSAESWPRTVQVEARVDGAWQAVGEPVAVSGGSAAPVVDVPADVRADAVRVVMTARDNTHLVVSEIEVMAKVPGEPEPGWDAGATYTGGEAVFHDDAFWTAQWWTRETPGSSVWGSWQETVRAADGTALWTPSRVFDDGDVVRHDGVTYRAQWWTRNQEPGQQHGPWQVLDA